MSVMLMCCLKRNSMKHGRSIRFYEGGWSWNICRETKYMLMFHHQSASKSYNVGGANKFYEKETMFTNWE